MNGLQTDLVFISQGSVIKVTRIRSYLFPSFTNQLINLYIALIPKANVAATLLKKEKRKQLKMSLGKPSQFNAFFPGTKRNMSQKSF